MESNRYARHAEQGFTLIELLIVMSIVIVLMAFAIPQGLRLKKNANQVSAVQTMRTIGQAEVSFNSSYPNVGYACSMAALGGAPTAGAPTPESAQILDPTLASTGAKSGYNFTITCGNKTTANNQDTAHSYQINGVPQSIGRSGDNGYCADENNIITVDPKGGINCTQPQ